MAKPPAGSSLLFGALADSGRIKERKNGTYRMVLKGIEDIDWFTDRPDRVAGEWSPKKLVKKWDGLFGNVEPNAQATFQMGSKRKLVTFEMFKPKLSDSNQTLSFKVRGIGEKNKDLLTGLSNKQLSDASLFIDDTPRQCLPNCEGADLSGMHLPGADMSDSNLTDADLSGSYLVNADLSGSDLSGADLSGSDLYYANLSGANLTDATLYKAFLYRTNLEAADLTEANLTEANLFSANLSGANLSGANLSGAYLNKTNLNGVTWNGTICPDGTINEGTYPCTPEQLLLV